MGPHRRCVREPAIHADGAPAPEFPDANGPQLASLRGSPVILEFFSPGCAFCAEAAPRLQEMAGSVLADEGVHVVSIEQSDSGEGTANARQHGKTWPTVVGKDGAAIASLYRVRSVPTYVMVNADGTMCDRGNWRDVKESVSKGRPCTAP